MCLATLHRVQYTQWLQTRDIVGRLFAVTRAYAVRWSRSLTYPNLCCPVVEIIDLPEHVFLY
jgi:hypothetical protein